MEKKSFFDLHGEDALKNGISDGAGGTVVGDVHMLASCCYKTAPSVQHAVVMKHEFGMVMCKSAFLRKEGWNLQV